MIFPFITTGLKMIIKGTDFEKLSLVYNFLTDENILKLPIAKNFPFPNSKIFKGDDNFFHFSCREINTNFTIPTRLEFCIEYCRTLIILLNNYSRYIKFYLPKIPAEVNDNDFSYVCNFSHILIPIKICKINSNIDIKDIFIFVNEYFNKKYKILLTKEDKILLRNIQSKILYHLKTYKFIFGSDSFKIQSYKSYFTTNNIEKNFLITNKLISNLKNVFNFQDLKIASENIEIFYKNKFLNLKSIFSFNFDCTNVSVTTTKLSHYCTLILCQINEVFYDINDLCFKTKFIIECLFYALCNKNIYVYFDHINNNDCRVDGISYMLKISLKKYINIFFPSNIENYVILREINE